MTQAIHTSDKKIIKYLSNICQFHHVMEDDHCVEISFHDENYLFCGTLRKHPLKNEIINLVSKFQKLKYFNVRKCKIKNFPEMQSSSLEHIDISCNDIEIFPNWILNQSNLNFLNLGANKLTHVPDLSHLPIETLKLHKNAISMFPKIWSQTKSLNLYLNQMKDIPNIVLDLNYLEVFSFGATDMKTLPSFSSLSNLRWITLTVNQIEFLPDDICSLSKLEGLQLAKNKLNKLPKRIGDTNLKAITLYCNEISELPESFFNLNLNKLNLLHNPLIKKDKERVSEIFGEIDFIRI